MKGKHGAAAAVRHEVQSAAQQIETYKHAVARLTGQLKAEKEARRANQQSRARVERELRARLDQGSSPKVEALERLVAQRTQERDQVHAANLKTREHLERALVRIRDHYQSEHNYKSAEALEISSLYIGVTDKNGTLWDPTKMPIAESLGNSGQDVNQLIVADGEFKERLLTLQRVRGVRR